MSRNVCGPEESWDPLVFLDRKNLKQLISERQHSGKVLSEELEEMSIENDDAAVGVETRQKIFLKTDCVNEASGSSYIEVGNCKLLCSVYGPREIPRKDDYDFKVANLNCEFRFASFSCFMQRKGTLSQRDQTLDEKNYSSVIEEALKPSILLHKYPKSQIDLYMLCIQNDIDSRNVLSAGIIAASMALVNASIELYDLVSAFTYTPINLTVAFMPSLHQVTSVYFSNNCNDASLSVDLFKSQVKEAVENCKKVHAYMKFVLLSSQKSDVLDEDEIEKNNSKIDS